MPKIENSDKKFYDFCKEKQPDFDERYSRNLYDLIKLHNGKINPVIIRGHFPLGWSRCVKIAEELHDNKLAVNADKNKLDDGVKFLPPEERLGLYKQ